MACLFMGLEINHLQDFLKFDPQIDPNCSNFEQVICPFGFGLEYLT